MLAPYSRLRRPAAFSAMTWTFLAVALLVTAFLALGAHDLAIAHLGIPYPYDDAVPSWARYLGQVVRMSAIVLISRMGAWYLDKRSPVAAAAIVGLTIVMLQETVRVLIVNIAIVDGLVGQRWLFMIIDALPNAIVSFFNGAAGLFIARRLWAVRHRPTTLVAAAVLTAAAIGCSCFCPHSKMPPARSNGH